MAPSLYGTFLIWQVHDLLEELKLVTDVPVLVVVDGLNYFHQMASSKVIQT